MTLRRIGRAGAAAGLALAGAVADALLATLVALTLGGVLSLAWYVVVEGAPPLAPILKAWRDDAPIALGLFLPPALTILVAVLTGLRRLLAVCWGALCGGATLVWVPRLRQLVSRRLA